MKYVFLGNFYPVNRIDEIVQNSTTRVDYAANNLQHSILNGLEIHCDNLELITLPVVGSYPLNYKKWFFDQSYSKYKNKHSLHCVNFNNIVLVKHVSRFLNTYEILNKISKEDSEVTIFIYSINSPFLKAVHKIKQNNLKVRLCLIVPDLPQFMSESRNPIYRVLKEIDLRFIKKYLKSIDSFVLLSDFMYDALNVGGRPWVRIEGICNLENQLMFEMKQPDCKIVLYTGTLDYRYGIVDLLMAFKAIDEPNFRLWICGDGNAKTEVVYSSRTDSRITYFGSLPTIEVRNLQKKATVLVNPRLPEGEFTKFSFPSKTLEYLASGTPCVMHRLPAIPNEYFQYIYFTDDNSYLGLKNKIIEICSMNQLLLNDFGKKAYDFIKVHKNPDTQVKKIIDMLDVSNQIDVSV